MFDLVGEIRNLITVMMQIEKDLKELIWNDYKSQKQEETKTGGTKK